MTLSPFRQMPANSGNGTAKRIPLSQLAMTGPQLGMYLDPEIMPDRNRLRTIVDEDRLDTDKLISAGTMERGQLRTFSGGLAHENGRVISRKARRLLHWEGIAQRSLLVRSESDYRFTKLDSECIRIVTSDGLERYEYYADVVLTRPDGTEIVVEVKRTEDDLKCPQVRRKYAAAHEIFRRCGMGFEIVFRDEIYASRHHRLNAELIACHAFNHVSQRHADRLENFAIRRGVDAAYGELAETLEPTSPVTGKGMIHALTVSRRIKMDISGPLLSDTHLTIY